MLEFHWQHCYISFTSLILPSLMIQCSHKIKITVFWFNYLKKKTELDTMHNRLQDGNNKLFVQNYTDEYLPFFFGLDWKQLPRRLWEWPPCCCHHRLSGRWMWWTLTIISMTSLGIGETSPSMTCCRNVLDDGCA